MSNSISVRKANEQDYDQWSRLYHGYAEFYEVPMNDEILQSVWGWLHDPEHALNCFLAVSDQTNQLVGLAHVRAMPSPLRGKSVGFLDDMFVDPEARGSKIGQKLFDALEQHGKEQGWPIIRWITADDNYRARGLYDKLSSKTMWNTYQMEIKQG